MIFSSPSVSGPSVGLLPDLFRRAKPEGGPGLVNGHLKDGSKAEILELLLG